MAYGEGKKGGLEEVEKAVKLYKSHRRVFKDLAKL